MKYTFIAPIITVIICLITWLLVPEKDWIYYVILAPFFGYAVQLLIVKVWIKPEKRN
ncbi:hypothetical protein HCJ66_01555 [Listeria sp. FSL L7-1582]|uniref:hypothetical protein n=1 Tax=Listeria portnoyi TaxID=2713504 RepID=UPI00164EC5DC|nr:hypothetical protein [Listeria portnoyi]MBC6308229.1 hypothetical protein [Listeria portnoyi]